MAVQLSWIEVLGEANACYQSQVTLERRAASKNIDLNQ
jgi:hypothetical protein